MRNKIFAVLAVMFLLVLMVPAAAFADEDVEYILGPAGEQIPVQEETAADPGEYTLTASGDNGNLAVVEDAAELFTAEQRTSLLNQLSELLGEGNFAIVTNSASNSGARDYAQSKYLEFFGDTSGALFLIDLYNRSDNGMQLVSRGAMRNSLTTAKANEIMDNTYTYAADGDFYGCAEKTVEQIKIVVEGGFLMTPMKYITNAAFAIGIVLLINFIIITVQRKRNSKLDTLVNALSYGSRGAGSTAVQNVNAVMTSQTKTRHTSSSGGGGGFSGGGGGFSGGGGGGFSGGGHSF